MMEGYASWGQLDSLLPAIAISEQLETVNKHLFSCSQQGNDDIIDLKPKFYPRINASIYSSNDNDDKNKGQIKFIN